MAKWQRIRLQCRNRRRCRFDPWVRKVHWRRGQATHSSILDWRIPWTEEPSGLQSIGSQKSDMTEVTQQARMQLNYGLNISTLKKPLSTSWIKPESKDSLWTTFSTLSLSSLSWLLVCFNALSLKASYISPYFYHDSQHLGSDSYYVFCTLLWWLAP